MNTKNFETYTVHELASDYGEEVICTHRDNLASVMGILLRNRERLDLTNGDLVEYLVTFSELRDLMDLLLVECTPLPGEDDEP